MRTFCILILLVASLGGCADQDIAPKQSLLGAADGEAGLVHAMVFADYGAPLQAARVSILGTIFSVQTDPSGLAEFQDVPAGTYQLRVERDGFLPVERQVRVLAGEVRHEEVVLVRIDQSPDGRTHRHNYWGSDTEVLLADARMAATPRHHTDFMAWYPEMGLNSVFNGVHRMNNNQTGEDPDYLFRIPVEEEVPAGGRVALVYPGSERVEVRVEWDSQLTRVEKMGVAYLPPEAPHDEVVILDRKSSGGVWTIPVGPGNADAGHQSFSFWNFFLYSGNELLDDPSGGHPVQYSLDTPFHVTLTAFKGSLYEEPPHRDFWNGQSEKRIVIESEQDIDPFAVRDWRVPNSGHMFLPEDEMIAPGTQQMVVQYTYVHGAKGDNDGQPLDAAAHPQTLTFRMADQNPWETPVGQYRQFDAYPCQDPPSWGTCLRYEIALDSGGADAYYQDRTLWAFLTNAQGYEEERRYTPAGGKITMELDITLYGPES